MNIAPNPSRNNILLLAVLILAGLAGNFLKYPVIVNIDFLFGSVFALLALQMLGPARAVLAAAVIAGSTWALWNHPYAVVIMTAEVVVVAWLTGRRGMGMVLADTLYWLVIGIPLTFLTYHLVMGVPLSNAAVVMTKHAINGIANAIAARMLFFCCALRFCPSQASYREIVYTLLAFFVMFPSLTMIAVESRTDFSRTDQQIQTQLEQESRNLTMSLQTWVQSRTAAVLTLAEMAASKTALQMQPHVELVKMADVNFLRVGLQDSMATVVAIFPLIDELGRRNIGKNYADRPFIPLLKQKLKPMLSEVVMSRIGIPKPTVSVLAPVVRGGLYSGYVIGVLSLEQVRRHIDIGLEQSSTLYTLIDKNGHVIMTNRSDQQVMTRFVRGQGTVRQFGGKGIYQWVPSALPTIPLSDQWKSSLYVAETGVGNLSEWKLILEQPVAPFQRTLYNHYSRRLTLLFMILLGALVLAEILSRRTLVTFEKLRLVTRDLPARLADNTVIDWPESGIHEADHLIGNFKEMADALSGKLSEIRLANDYLERRVEERTLELRARERFIVDVIDSLGSRVAVLDSSGIIVSANKTWLSFDVEYGATLSTSNSVGKNYLDMCRESLERENDALAAFTGIHAVLMGEREHFSLEYPWHSEREQYWFQMVVTRLKGTAGGAVVSHTDISKRKLAEEALLKSEELLKLSQRLAKVGGWDWDPRFRTTIWTDETYRIHDLDPGEIRAGSPEHVEISLNCYAEKDRQALLDAFQRCIEQGDEYDLELPFTSVAGRKLWVRTSGHVMREGERIVKVVGTIMDITERKRAEETLLELKQYSDQIIQSAQEGIIVYGLDLRYQVWNPFMEQMSGMAAAEVVGRHPHELFPFLRHTGMIEYLKKVLDGEPPVETDFQYNIPSTGKQGWASNLSAPLRNTQGEIIGIIATVREITRSKQMEGALRTALEAAELSNATMRRLMNTVAHEFRTPLGLLTGCTDILDRYWDRLSPEKRMEQNHHIRSATRQLSTLIDSVLVFNRSREDCSCGVPVQLDIAGVCRIVATEVVAVWGSGQQFDSRIDTSCGCAFMNEILLRRILENLLSNAFRYTPAQGTVSLRVFRENNRLVLEVADSGIGIPEEDQALIFEAFFRCRNVEGRRGLGLGLSLVHDAVQRMGGTIALASRLGRGTTVLVEIPIGDAQQESTEGEPGCTQ